MFDGWKIIAFAFTLRLLFLIAIPCDENNLPFTLSAYNDEKAHYKHIEYIALNKSRPLQTTSVADYSLGGDNEFEYYQSPLYYRLAAYIYNYMPDNIDKIKAFRFINCILGLLLILTIGRFLFLFSPLYSSAGMLFLSVLPSTVIFSVTVTNDVLFWLFSALFVYSAVNAMQNDKIFSLIIAVFFFSAAVWTKISGLILSPAMIFACYSVFAFQKPLKRVMSTFLLSIAALLSVLPLLRDNYSLYGHIIPMSVGSGTPYRILESLSPHALLQTGNFILHSFYLPSYNYWQGNAHLAVFIFLGVFSLALIYFTCKKMVYKFKTAARPEKNTLYFTTILLFSTLAGLLWMSLRYHQSEARLAFMALPAIVYFFLAGLDKITERRSGFFLKTAFFLPAIPYILLVCH